MKKSLILLLFFMVSCSAVTVAPKLKRETIYKLSQEYVEKTYGEYVPLDKIGFYRRGPKRPWYVNLYGEEGLYLLDISEDGEIIKAKKVIEYTNKSVYRR
ncbi:hypothetical protein [Caviibacter abscessus]|uniref:hypothetical protein n=1 Tax=Caviibacter abscessus TaxID=1766719 RepID=UPI0008301BE0|nr:hypothetical protein [Caviibacter abscessus]